ncbi:hypothetical protein [Microvirga sp. TS319]|uniref:hypothetical protein n=1 Tax=Microvirga sp. TS319 TaxID=3241165 RepID=UPI00351A496B
MKRSLAIVLLGVVAGPKIAMAYVSRDDIPGGEAASRKSDRGFPTKRGHGRHDMAGAESIVARDWTGLPSGG